MLTIYYEIFREIIDWMNDELSRINNDFIKRKVNNNDSTA